ncbi:urea ABC transporter substrate-binding protein [Mycolicibacterium conceptionense]|jgi:urea transport system substrate-binding protein|uniref:ABC transporter substrate-binding protein n=2 Tax=Mycolicibacterium TaxID=1866885 RepID=A0A0J8U380_9MYCO|nr:MULTISPECIES: urea ABC transporter substrate-binding protein [Mycolicibacterium]KLI04914.1 ABC transporter substrate-binding protein [Mycolicibacterium senegalense]KLO50732.1 ABC transporter substrate-binding protein [Mycolicibacterium senegalense]KMV14885.1 ABC transporter substrate-binding protein [Mycolicibacterium conceptionense]MCW1820479.1 urea ABC transporter substrate-binding protein [Mycolicibacterium senegalense]OBB14422.1 urea ABC transporter substrate-binding protein [Mycoliciba
MRVPGRAPLRRSTLAAGSLIAAASLLLAGCGSRASETDSANAASCVDTSGPKIKVGSLNSLSGTMAISEVTVRDAIKLAVEEINSKGGVLGKQIELIGEDGASEPTVFAEKAEKLISSDCVAAVFGGWTSSSRKAMLPVFESANALLYYPVQYEGLESSKNIFYTGATTNQQIVPALDYLKEKGVKSLYLVGSDYVFPQTANRIIKAYAKENGIEIKGEDYTPLGSTDFSTIVNKVRSADADAVFNTLNGDSNVAFFREYRNVGLTPQDMPVVSVSIAEEEVGGIGVQNVAGQLTAWNYYETIDTPVNKAFVKAYKDFVKDPKKPTSDPMEAAYVSVYLWKNTVEKAKSFDVAAIQDNADGVSFDAPEGKVTIDGENHHITKTARIGEIRPDGLIYTIWESKGPIEPDPYLKSYPWAAGLSG